MPKKQESPHPTWSLYSSSSKILLIKSESLGKMCVFQCVLCCFEWILSEQARSCKQVYVYFCTSHLHHSRTHTLIFIVLSTNNANVVCWRERHGWCAHQTPKTSYQWGLCVCKAFWDATLVFGCCYPWHYNVNVVISICVCISFFPTVFLSLSLYTAWIVMVVGCVKNIKKNPYHIV